MKKEHKILLGSVAAIIGGYALLKIGSSPKTANIKPQIGAAFVPNRDMNAVDFFVGSGENRNHVYVFDPLEAKGLLIELEDCIACLG